MKLRRNIRRAVLLLAASIMLLAVPAASFAATAGSGTAASGTGWIRLAHLSPNTPPVDVYLYSFGNPDARMVLRHVAYGDVSAYLAVPGGEYSVAMRPAGASPTSPPVLSSDTRVTSGSAYTVLGVGLESGLRLRVFHDDLSTPSGKALVRVVQASMKHSRVTVSWGGKIIASKLPFASVTSYQAVSPGAATAGLTASGAGTKSAVTLTAGSIHTFVILDGAKGLELTSLKDADGSSKLPVAAPPTTRATPVAAPAALSIPEIGVSTRLITLGITASGAVQVPSTTEVAGWYTHSPRPGAVGPAIILGHIDSAQGPGVFFRLAGLAAGEPVYVRRSGGSTVEFRVTAVKSYLKDHFPTTPSTAPPRTPSSA
jgi:hypothetical protein